MSCSSDLDVRRREISALLYGVIEIEQSVGLIDALDYEDRAEARDIIARIERRLLATTPPTTDQREAAE